MSTERKFESGWRPSDPVFDRVAALERMSGDVQVLRELAELFLAECPRMLGGVSAAVERRDPAAIEQSAHKLRSAVSNFFAKTADDAATQLEAMGKNRSMSGVEAAHAVLEDAIRSLQLALRTFIAADA